jgi:hypothetical protein
MLLLITTIETPLHTTADIRKIWKSEALGRGAGSVGG